jgi:hypothetical protein
VENVGVVGMGGRFQKTVGDWLILLRRKSTGERKEWGERGTAPSAH